MLTVKNLSHSFDNTKVLNNVDFAIEKGDKVGLIGPNGCGKTTLLDLITKRLSVQQGEVVLGHNVKISYFSQQRDDLNISNNLLEEIWEVKPHWKEGEVRSYLAKFLFTQEQVFSLVSSLSGGEQSRLAMAN